MSDDRFTNNGTEVEALFVRDFNVGINDEERLTPDQVLAELKIDRNWFRAFDSARIHWNGGAEDTLWDPFTFPDWADSLPEGAHIVGEKACLICSVWSPGGRTATLWTGDLI